MAHRSAHRTVGRHRGESLRRHRAGASPAPSPRAVLVSAALGATLIAGLTGGPAYAAENDIGTATGIGIGAPGDIADEVGTSSPDDDHAAGTSDSTTAVGPDGNDDARGAVELAAGTSGDDDARAAVELAVGAPSAIRAASAARTASRGAQTVRKKNRPRPVNTTATVRSTIADASWVNPNPAAATTSCFGPRWGRLHAGVDLAAPSGTPIVAAGAGVVVRAGEEGGYGNAVLIDHGNGYLTHYGHLSTITVQPGRRVRTGEQIGTEGSTGHSTGPHLHFEVHAGSYHNPIEPTRWLAARGVTVNGC